MHSQVVDRRSLLHVGYQKKNMESLTVDYSGFGMCHTICTLKTSFIDSQKE
jgi:hypothetical protein